MKDNTPARFVSSQFELGSEPVTEATIVLLPLGAHEQHGQHLPFDTDTTIADGVCRYVVEHIKELDSMQMNDIVDLRILPTEQVGYSPEHMDFAGSKSLTYGEALERWIDIGDALAKSGVKRVMLMNAHGGNSPLVTIVCQELRVRFGILAVGTKWDRFLTETKFINSSEKLYGIHGGDIETSVMLKLAPHRVDMSKAAYQRNLQEKLLDNFTHLRAYGSHAFGWKMQDLNSKGVVGNAAQATAEKGEKLLREAAAGIVALLHDMMDFRLSWLK